jgi:LDH2 family malate/lactate/ureidoglycolate dehydrogenase
VARPQHKKEHDEMPASYETHRKQLELILQAWGMPAPVAASTAEIMSWADLHGIDTHGISMVPPYDERRRNNKLDLRAEPKVLKETPVSVLIDGGGGLGHPNARRGMELAIEKAKKTGIGVAAVRNSGHFGACGFYSLMAVDADLIGMVTTSASGIQVSPTNGAQARLGTDPISFAAPGRPGQPFLLDMATTTVAAGKIRNKANENLPAPQGWLVTKDGQPSTDPKEVSKGGFMTPLGGTPEGSSHKGYGLGAMVNILSSALSGGLMVTDPTRNTKPGSIDIGHFFLALDPGMFRDVADFKTDVATFCDTLRATRPADPAKPVQVAGDPERRIAAERMKTGIPVGPNLLEKVREIAIASGAPWIIGN